MSQPIAPQAGTEQGVPLTRLQRWLRTGSIPEQMGRFFNLFAIGTLVLIAMAIYGVTRVDQKAEAYSNLVYANMNVAEGKILLKRAGLDLELLPVRNDKEAAIDAALADTRRAREIFEQVMTLEMVETSSSGSPLSEILSETRQIETDIAALQGAGVDGLAQAQASRLIIAGIGALDTRITSFGSEVDGQLYAMASDGMEEVQRLVTVLFIIGLVSVGLVILGRTLVTRQFSGPLARMSGTAERIAKGETQLHIPGQDRRDEIGTMARALGVLRDVQSSVISQAQRDLEREKELQEEREKQEAERAVFRKSLAAQFEETVGDVASEVAAAADQLRHAANSLAETVDLSSSRVEDANAQLGEASRGMTGAAAATDEFALAISEVSRQAKVSSERANKAAEAAASADQTIGAMTESADQISQIVEVITAIAQRTNLLALNASIEAARSAEAGRGFAVVANEVKELASQTRRETAQVETLITSMQNATGVSASALSTIASEVIELETAAGAIASSVDQQANAGQDLAQAIDMAARNTSQASESFANVNEMTAASTATANQLRDSSEILSAQSDRLREHVAAFLEQVRVA